MITPTKYYHSSKHFSEFCYKMAAKIIWHRCGTKLSLRHCHPMYRGAEYCDEPVFLRVCVCPRSRPIFTKYLCMLPMAAARYSSSGVVTRYVLPIIWMTSCLLTSRPATAQRTRSLGLCYKLRTSTSCRPTDALDYFSCV